MVIKVSGYERLTAAKHVTEKIDKDTPGNIGHFGDKSVTHSPVHENNLTKKEEDTNRQKEPDSGALQHGKTRTLTDECPPLSLDNFAELPVPEQIKLLIHCSVAFHGRLLDQCTAEQRKRLSGHADCPQSCWPPLNIRRLEDATKTHIDNHMAEMFRLNNHSQEVDEALAGFRVSKIPEALFAEPKYCAHLLCKLIQTEDFLKRTPLTVFEQACYSSPIKQLVQERMAQALRDAKDLMNDTDRDLFTIAMRVISHAYQQAPLLRDRDTRGCLRVAKNDLLKQFANDLFMNEEVVSDADPVAEGSSRTPRRFSFFGPARTEKNKPHSAYASMINATERVKQKLSRAQSVLLVLLELSGQSRQGVD